MTMVINQGELLGQSEKLSIASPIKISHYMFHNIENRERPSYR
jgi:hypothetical protein